MLKHSNIYNDLRVTRRGDLLRRKLQEKGETEFLVREPTPCPACEVDFKFPTARSEMASLSVWMNLMHNIHTHLCHLQYF